MSAYEAVRILLVSAQETVRDEVASALQSRLPQHQLRWVAHPDLALGQAQDLMPHLILVDDELPGTSLDAFVRELAPQVRGAAILLLMEPSGLPQISQMMLASAQGFVPKPLDQEQLANSLQGLLQARVPTEARMGAPTRSAGRVIVFAAAQGGTGCTTLATNIALGLSQQTAQPTVLVDASYAAPAVDVALNLRDGHSIADLLPRLSRMDEELARGMLPRHTSGMYALQAPPMGSLSAPIPRTQIHQVVDILRRSFAWVIVDAGLPIGEAAWAWLDVADRLVLSVLPQTVSLHNTRQMIAQLQEQDYRQDRVRLVVNQATLVNGVKLPDIESYIHFPVAETISADQSLVTHAMNHGVPAILSHDHSALVRDYRRLVQQIVEELPCRDIGKQQADSPRQNIATWPIESSDTEPVIAWQIKPKHPAYGLPIAPTPKGDAPTISN